MKSHIAFYIPVNYNPTIFPAKHRDYAHYLLNLIHWRTIIWRTDKKGFVRLKWLYLQKVIPRALWRPLRIGLENAGVIEIDKLAINNKQCWGYKLHPSFHSTHRVICKNPKILGKIKTIKPDTSRPVARWLESKLILLQWNFAKAVKIISAMEPDSKSPCSLDEYRRIILAQAERLRDGEHEFTRDRFGRVHTLITRLPKTLRCCLRISGEGLVAIDLANSQPLMAGFLARQFFGASRKGRNDLLNRAFNGGHHRRMKLLPKSHREDIEEYITLCEKGQLYDSFKKCGKSREQIKKQFFQSVFFGRIHYKSNLEAEFAELFPSMAEMLKTIKRKNYKTVAHLLQNIESRIFIDAICGQIRKTYPHLPMFTIHDCLLVPSRWVAKVEKIMTYEFYRLGFSPTLNNESY